ncbi:DNA-binding transcriptional regulator of sugar metabolism [Commensalibacter communis]|uniref:DeoR/GlpR family DNA-binding transcription regulator n=1 Tax=Commensalibacter communis TaxID=2972786 RepID=UPI0022FFBE61|nr:DeoR/GlpR family DNA-binding transcription regulator [Commensalibacter communis]CAI3948960.1 DNA-binding transcriptional regulator of sugar metabolism [Commensalibacter communis]
MLDYAAFPQQRQELIHRRLLKNGSVVCAVLAEELNVSEHTIRRDLQELSQQGICKKVYGGAVLSALRNDNFVDRKQSNYDEKKQIAQKCIEFIQDNGCVFLDASTTNLALAKALPKEIKGTFVTNSPEIAVSLLQLEYCEVILLGGEIHRDTGGCIGGMAIQQIQEMIFDQVFIGGCAMDPEVGLTGFCYADCEFKKIVIKQANQVIVPLTKNKISMVARYVVARSEEIDIIVMSTALDATLSSQFKNNIRFYHTNQEK